MADSPLPPPPPPPPPPPRPNFPMLYYGLIVVATAAVILVLYNLIVVKWCNHLSDRGPPRPPAQRIRRRRRLIPTWRIESSTLNSIATFKYEGGDSECAVCLSVFEEGEEIRQLPKCKHNFHAPCIDTWLYSHLDCPLCRTPVDPALLRPPEESERSRDGLLPGAAVFLV